MNNNEPLQRVVLIAQGKCCGHGCKYCPYDPPHVKGTTKLKDK